MARRRLLLKKFEITNVNYLWLGAYRLRVEASDPLHTGTDPNVFLFLRHPLNPHTHEVVDEFLGVASPADMSEYPAHAPDHSTAFPIFRSAAFEIDLRQVEQARKVWLLIQEEVNHLLLALDRMEQLVPTEEVWVGAPPPAEPEGGSSGSLST
jgi:hypothetical protein